MTDRPVSLHGGGPAGEGVDGGALRGGPRHELPVVGPEGHVPLTGGRALPLLWSRGAVDHTSPLGGGHLNGSVICSTILQVGKITEITGQPRGGG